MQHDLLFPAFAFLAVPSLLPISMEYVDGVSCYSARANTY